MKFKFLPALVLFFFFSFSFSFLSYSQCTILPNAIQGISYTYVQNGGTNASGVAFNPNFNIYYAVIAGNSGFPFETFTPAGVSLYQTNAGFDFRGLWWNPNLGQLEGNGYNTFGIWNANLTGTGYALNTGANIFTGMNQPNAQSCGDYDYCANEIIYYNAGSIYRYSHATNALLGSYTLTGMPVPLSNINIYSVVYTGCPGNEIGIEDYVNKTILFFDKLTGAYSGTCQLPLTAVTNISFRFSFANDLVWLYDVATRTWTSFTTFTNGGGGGGGSANLGNDTTLCTGQTLTLSPGISGACVWQNGSTNPTFTVSSTGTYWVAVTTSCNLYHDTIVVSYLPAYNVNNPQAICTGGSYTINSHIYTTAGNYHDTLPAVTFCDSIIVTQLSVNASYNVNNPQAICNGGSYVFNSHTYTTAGNFYDTLSTTAGCDSIITTQLTVNATYNQNVSAVTCSGYSYTFPDGTTATTSTTHSSHLTTAAGCDSFIVTQLTVQPVYNTNNPQSVCNGASYSINSHTYNIAGTYHDTLATVAGGCDSIIVTQLNVIAAFNTNNPQAICNGGSYTINAHTYSTAGTYHDTLTAAAGCDSIIHTQLTVNPTYNLNVSASACNGNSYTFPDGTTATTSTSHSSNLLTVAGCDSIIVTQLTFHPVYSANNPQTICNGDSYLFNGHSYTAAGTYNDTLASIAGCDSVIIITLTVNPVPQLLIVLPNDMCIDDPALPLNFVTPTGGTYSGAGVSNNIFTPQTAGAGTHPITYSYTDPVSNCTNTIIQNITVHPLPVVAFSINPATATLNNAAISFVDLTSGSVNWLWDFGDGSSSQNKNEIHTYNATGTFSVTLTVTDNFGCKGAGTGTVFIGQEFAFYVPNAFTPNEDGSNDFFSGTGTGIKNFHMIIFDRWGQTIFESDDMSKVWDGSSQPIGIYIYKIDLSDSIGAPHEYVGHVAIVK